MPGSSSALAGYSSTSSSNSSSESTGLLSVSQNAGSYGATDSSGNRASPTQRSWLGCLCCWLGWILLLIFVAGIFLYLYDYETFLLVVHEVREYLELFVAAVTSVFTESKTGGEANVMTPGGDPAGPGDGGPPLAPRVEGPTLEPEISAEQSQDLRHGAGPPKEGDLAHAGASLQESNLV